MVGILPRHWLDPGMTHLMSCRQALLSSNVIQTSIHTCFSRASRCSWAPMPACFRKVSSCNFDSGFTLRQRRKKDGKQVKTRRIDGWLRLETYVWCELAGQRLNPTYIYDQYTTEALGGEVRWGEVRSSRHAQATTPAVGKLDWIDRSIACRSSRTFVSFFLSISLGPQHQAVKVNHPSILAVVTWHGSPPSRHTWRNIEGEVTWSGGGTEKRKEGYVSGADILLHNLDCVDTPPEGTCRFRYPTHEL